jgi:hypothetical protein
VVRIHSPRPNLSIICSNVYKRRVTLTEARFVRSPRDAATYPQATSCLGSQWPTKGSSTAVGMCDSSSRCTASALCESSSSYLLISFRSAATDRSEKFQSTVPIPQFVRVTRPIRFRATNATPSSMVHIRTTEVGSGTGDALTVEICAEKISPPSNPRLTASM